MRESARGSRAAGAAPVAAAVVLVLAGVALAVVPPAGTYRGTTDQRYDGDHHARVKVNMDHRVTVVDIGWRAKCNDKGAFWYGTTRFEKPKQDGGHFHHKGTYHGKTDDGAYEGPITVSLDGHFPTAKWAKGTFSSKVKVMKASTGKQVDSCKTSTTWHATSDRQSVAHPAGEPPRPGANFHP